MTNATGTIVQSYTYDAYGNIQNQTGTIRQPFNFTGREFDSETGLYFYRARMYDARIGRFIQNDPIGFAGGDVNLARYVDSVGKPLLDVNLYRYTGNNPINKIDPKGLEGYDPNFGGGNVPYGYDLPKLKGCHSDNPCQLICNGMLYLPRVILATGAYVATKKPSMSSAVMIGSAPISSGICYVTCGGRVSYLEFGRTDNFDANGNYMGFGGP
jgi:RHS repeat-associated protein